MVLAAGLGTRLRPLTNELPKPLVPIGDRPAIAHVLDRLRPIRERGARRGGALVVNGHHGALALEAALVEWPDLAISNEPELLGTAGGVAHAAHLLGEGDVVLWNADVQSEFDPASLVAAAAADPRADAVLAVNGVGPALHGNVGFDAEGRVVRLRKQSFGPNETNGAHFLGIHLLGGRIRSRLPSRGCLVGDFYIPLGVEGARMVVHPTRESFIDVGTPGAYVAANEAWLRRRGIDSWVQAVVPADVIVGRNVIVPASATISGHGLLERVIAWPGAAVSAPLRDAIVTPRQTLSLVP